MNSKTNPNDRFPRLRLIKLIKQRENGNKYLPQNNYGRRMLIALLCFGLSDDEASGFGPWCETELRTLKHRAFCVNKRHVGELIGMTTPELVQFKLWHLGLPIDQTVEEYEAWEKKRESEQRKKRQQDYRDRLRDEKKRKLEKADDEPNFRARAVRKILIEHDGPMVIASIREAASKKYEFHNLKDAALRKAVARAVKYLKAKDEIMTSKRPGRTGEVWVFIPAKDTRTLGQRKKDDKSIEINALSENHTRNAVSRIADGVTWLSNPTTQQAEKPKDVAGIHVEKEDAA